jgi:uncharacterized integral membrane protein
MTQILKKDPSMQLPHITAVITTVEQPNNTYMDMQWSQSFLIAILILILILIFILLVLSFKLYVNHI